MDFFNSGRFAADGRVHYIKVSLYIPTHTQYLIQNLTKYMFFFLDFQEVLDPPAIVPSSQYQLSLAFPDLGQHKVSDLFSTLGPVAIFSAKHHWTAPRTVRLKKREHEGYGFSVRGDAPVIIAGVDIGSIAEVIEATDRLQGVP